MEYITTVHVNCVSDEREEEYSNWYNYVHLRDVMGLPGHISAQRFWRAKYQPENYDPTFKFYTIYELTSKELSTEGHRKCQQSWRMMISSAMDLKKFKESYWDGVYGSVPYACYSEYGPDNYNLVALIGVKEGESANVEDIFTMDVVNKLGAMEGVYAANLYRFAPDQMAKKTATAEQYTHQLILQLSDARDGVASWDAFAKATPELAKLDISICNYVSLMPRLKACDRFETPQDRAISSLYHMMTKLPGHYAGAGKNMTDVLTPAIKKKLDALETEENT